jgi:predicted HAD superfamily hydrolase
MLGILETDYWFEIGYEYAGAVAYGYSRFIEAQAKQNNIEQILFIARDGYTLQKVFETFNADMKGNYVYAPRFLNLICRLDYEKRHQFQPKIIVDYYIKKSADLKSAYESVIFNDSIDYHNFILNNREVIEKLADKEYEPYKNYLSRIVVDDKICFVETITGMFSVQRLLEDALRRKIYGIYWTIIDASRANIDQNVNFCDWKTHKNIKNWDFVELLLTAPEYPIKGIDASGSPIYDQNPTEYETTRKNLYPAVSNGALLFAQDIKEIFGGNDIFLDSKTLVEWINIFCDNPSAKDIKNMALVFHSTESDHRDYIPIFSKLIPFSYALRRPKKAIKEIKSLPLAWRTNLQTLALCLKSPIKIKMRGIQRLQIKFFPYLKNCYFNMILRFSDKCFYRISLGNDIENAK